MRFHVGFVLFPNVTQLDFTGPLQVLSRLPDAEVHLVAKTMAPVPSDGVLSLPPTTTFAECPQLDLICVPGGHGVAEQINDAETVGFIRHQAMEAKYVTSVCTGSFLLGAAGLLKGKKATSHWAYTDVLPMVGATHEPARVVRDGNVITAGGVTSGIDFAFTVLAEIAGEEVAKAVQLGLEYDPEPPFRSGSPALASDAVKAQVAPRYAEAAQRYRDELSMG